MSNASVNKALPDIPLEQIKGVLEQHPDVRLIFKRQTAKGTWASLPSVTMATAELATLDDWLREQHGGGRYRISARNPQNELDEIVTPFYVEISGAPKQLVREPDPSHQPRMRAPGGPLGFQSGPASPAMPWRGMQYVRDAHPEPAGNDLDPSQFMSQTPDAIAMENVRALRDELRDLRADQVREKREHEQRLEGERLERAKIEKEGVKEQQRHEKELMALRMEMIAKTSAPPATAPVDYVGLLAGLAPVLVAMISAGKDKQALLLQAQQATAQQQTAGMQTMLATIEKGNKPDNSMKDLLVLALPLVMKVMDEKSPGAVTKLISAMADNQLQTISMVSQLMTQMAPDNDNPWMDVARKAIEGVQSVAEQMVDVQVTKATGTTRQQRNEMPANATPVAQQPVTQLTARSAPTDFADALFNSPNLPAEMRSKEWYALFTQLHDLHADPRATAIALSQHLETLADADRLPPMFAGMLDENGPAPSTLLRPFLEQLPLAQLAPQRLDSLCAIFDEILTADAAPEENRAAV